MTEHAEITRAVRDLILTGERFRARAGRTRGLSPSAVTALTSLYLDGARTPSELASVLDIATASATELLDKLQALTFIRRRPHPADRRKLLIELTQSGEKEIGTIFQAFVARVEPLARTMSPSERTTVLDFVRETHRRLRGPDVEPDEDAAS